MSSKIQTNRYEGTPVRCWVGIDLVRTDGHRRTLKVVADTGSPYALMVGAAVMRHFGANRGSQFTGPYGPMTPATINVEIPEIGLAASITAYECPMIEALVKASHQNFDGLVGLPLLQLTEYGGNDKEFWVKPLPTLP